MRDSVPSARYSPICNVLRQWKTSLIPTYRVYLLYDIYMYIELVQLIDSQYKNEMYCTYINIHIYFSMNTATCTCICLCINHPFTAFNQISFFLCRSLALFMVIITIFLFELRFKTYRRPYVIVPEFFISRKVRFSVRCNYSVPRPIYHAVVLTHAANATLDGQGICDPG